MPKKTRRKSKGTAAGREIIAGLTELAETLERGEMESARFTVRTVEVTDPGEYRPAQVHAVRQSLGASQDIFARLLGVSRILVQSWERGVRTPAPVHRRLMDAMRADPRRWASLLVPSVTHAGVKPRTAVAGRIGFEEKQRRARRA